MSPDLAANVAIPSSSTGGTPRVDTVKAWHKPCSLLGQHVDIESTLGAELAPAPPPASTAILIRRRLTLSPDPQPITMRWRVELHRDERGVIHRCVDVQPWAEDADQKAWKAWGASTDWRPELDIWPSWHQIAATLKVSDPKALVAADQKCTAIGDRLRESAKWMATVIGLTIGSIIGTSPLKYMRERPALAWVALVIGLLLLTGTLILVVRVLQPRPVAFEDILKARKGPLRQWRRLVESEQDLYLPCGTRCLTTLRETMLVDELTLTGLAQAFDPSDKDKVTHKELEEAIRGRMYRLAELRESVSRIVSVADFYVLRRQSTRATYAGGIMATVAAILISVAFAYDLPR